MICMLYISLYESDLIIYFCCYEAGQMYNRAFSYFHGYCRYQYMYVCMFKMLNVLLYTTGILKIFWVIIWTHVSSKLNDIILTWVLIYMFTTVFVKIFQRYDTNYITFTYFQIKMINVLQNTIRTIYYIITPQLIEYSYGTAS